MRIRDQRVAAAMVYVAAMFMVNRGFPVTAAVAVLAVGVARTIGAPRRRAMAPATAVS